MILYWFYTFYTINFLYNKLVEINLKLSRTINIKILLFLNSFLKYDNNLLQITRRIKISHFINISLYIQYNIRELLGIVFLILKRYYTLYITCILYSWGSNIANFLVNCWSWFWKILVFQFRRAKNQIQFLFFKTKSE